MAAASCNVQGSRSCPEQLLAGTQGFDPVRDREMAIGANKGPPLGGWLLVRLGRDPRVFTDHNIRNPVLSGKIRTGLCGQ